MLRESAISRTNDFCSRLIESGIYFLIFFTPVAYGAVQPWAVAVFEVTAAVTALLWIFKIFLKRRLKLILNPAIAAAFFFIPYVCMQFAFPLNNVDGNSSGRGAFGSVYPWATKTELLKVVAYAMIFLAVTCTVRTRRQIVRILSAVTAAGFITGLSFLMRYFRLEAPGSLVNPDHLSCYLGLIIPASLGLLFMPSQDLSISTIRAKRFLIFTCVIVMSASLFLTMSRGGMLSFISSFVFMAILARKRGLVAGRGWILSAAIFIAATVAWLGATPVIERITSVKAEVASLYFGGRLPIWQGAVNIIKDYPLFGSGLGTFNYVFPGYQPASIMDKHYTYAHSDFLELLSETGVTGFTLSVIFGLLFAAWLFRRFQIRGDPSVLCLSVGFFGSAAHIFFHSFVDFSMHIPAVAILVTILLALFIVTLNLKRNTVLAENVASRISDGKRRIALNGFCLAAAAFAVLYIIASVKPALAERYARTSDPSKAEGTLVKAVDLDPGNAKYHYQLGKLYSTRPEKYAHVQDMLHELGKAVELNPTNGKYRQSLAWTYGQLSDLPEPSSFTYSLSTEKCRELAHREFQKAIQLEPNNSYRYRAYGIWLSAHPSEENKSRYEQTVALMNEGKGRTGIK